MWFSLPLSCRAVHGEAASHYSYRRRRGRFRVGVYRVREGRIGLRELLRLTRHQVCPDPDHARSQLSYDPDPILASVRAFDDPLDVAEVF
jgi:hypothetical protein